MNPRYRLLQEPKDQALNWSCLYAPTPSDETCLAEATWHGFVLDDPAQRIVAMMSCCDEHKKYMALSADFVHPMDSPCAVPGSHFRWPENECYLPEGEHGLTLAEMVEVSA